MVWSGLQRPCPPQLAFPPLLLILSLLLLLPAPHLLIDSIFFREDSSPLLFTWLTFLYLFFFYCLRPTNQRDGRWSCHQKQVFLLCSHSVFYYLLVMCIMSGDIKSQTHVYKDIPLDVCIKMNLYSPGCHKFNLKCLEMFSILWGLGGFVSSKHHGHDFVGATTGFPWPVSVFHDLPGDLLVFVQWPSEALLGHPWNLHTRGLSSLLTHVLHAYPGHAGSSLRLACDSSVELCVI